MSRVRSAERESFRIVSETCPAVDAAMEAIINAATDATIEIKNQTTTLREALIDALERANEAEDRVESLENEVWSLKQEIKDLKSEMVTA